MQEAQLTQKYEAMTRAHDWGAYHGNQNEPKPNATDLSDVELAIRGSAQDDLDRLLTEFSAECDASLRKLRSDIASSPEELKQHSSADYEGKLGLELSSLDASLQGKKERVLALQQEYRWFKEHHRRPGDANPAASTFLAISLLILVAVLDGLLNAYFFKEASPLALLGGFVFALGVSGFNTLSGFATGILPWRYLHHRNRLHLMWSLPVLVIMFLLFFVFNLGVAHYREMLLSDPDTQAAAVMGRMASNPIGIQTLQSWMLALIGLAIALYSAYKGYNVFDPYPRYGRLFKRKKAAEDAYEEAIKAVQRPLKSFSIAYVNGAKSEFESGSNVCQSALSRLDQIASDSQESGQKIAAIEQACNAVIQIYRGANTRVRDNSRYPPPPYFRVPVRLRKPEKLLDFEELQRLRLVIQQRQEKLRGSHERVVREVAEIGRSTFSEGALKARVKTLDENAQRAVERDTPMWMKKELAGA